MAGTVLQPTRASAGLKLTHRRYIDFSRAHYAGNLVDGGSMLGLYSDIATDLCILTDGHEGLFASYGAVTFHAPVKAGDILEVGVEILRVGKRSRHLAFKTIIIARATPETGIGSAQTLPEPILAVSAEGTVVIPVSAPNSE